MYRKHSVLLNGPVFSCLWREREGAGITKAEVSSWNTYLCEQRSLKDITACLLAGWHPTEINARESLLEGNVPASAQGPHAPSRHSGRTGPMTSAENLRCRPWTGKRRKHPPRSSPGPMRTHALDWAGPVPETSPWTNSPGAMQVGRPPHQWEHRASESKGPVCLLPDGRASELSITINEGALKSGSLGLNPDHCVRALWPGTGPLTSLCPWVNHGWSQFWLHGVNSRPKLCLK